MSQQVGQPQKFYFECPNCNSRFFSEPMTLGVRHGVLTKIHPVCTNCFEKCPQGHEFGYGEGCKVCGAARRRFNLIRHVLDPDDPTFGITSTGSTSYPTSTAEAGSTLATSNLTNVSVRSSKISMTVAGTITSLGIGWGGTESGINVRLGLYSHNAGGDKPNVLLVESVETAASTSAGWQDIMVANTYVAIGTYWVAWGISGTKTIYYSNTGRRSFYTKSYGAFDATWSAGSTEGNDSGIYQLRCTFVQIKGYAKTTKVTLTESASCVTVSFYAHATGNVRLGIYSDSSGPDALQWESGSAACSPTAWATVNISAGTPSSLTLSSGTYWLAWQWDSVNSGPSYASGGANTGAYLAQAYGAFPNPMTGETLSTENWSLYVTYGAELIQVSDSLTLAETVTALYINFVTDTFHLHEFVSYQKGVIRINEMDLPHVTSITITDEASIIDKKVQGGNLPKRDLEGKMGRSVQIAGWTMKESDLYNMDQLLDGEPKTLLLPSGDSFAIRVQSVRPSGSAKLLGGSASSAICGIAVCNQSVCGTMTSAWAPKVTYTLNAGELKSW